MSTSAPVSDQPTGIGRLIGSVAALFLFFVSIEIAPLPAPGEAPPASPEARRLQDATALMSAGKWADALAPVRELSDQYPANHIYAEHLATINGHLGRPADEASAWERFVASSPSPYEACPRIGDAYRRAGRIDRAADAFQRCLGFDPGNAEMQFYAGHAAEWTGDWAAATRLYQSASAIDPHSIDVRLGLGRVALHENRFDEARRVADQVLTEQDDADAALLGGMAAFRAGHNAAARAYLERGLRRSPDYADLHFYLGLVEESAGHAPAAAAEFARAAALEPQRPEFKARVSKGGGK